VTARWVVEAVAPHRDLEVTWQPISLLMKNEVGPDHERYPVYYRSHQMLRVMEAIRAEYGHDAVEPWYLLCGATIHHDGNRDHADIVEMLEHLGLDPAMAGAADDTSWDAEIRRRMDQGLALAGDDIGTPIVATDNHEGERHAFFGPVITRVPPGELSLKLWDGLIGLMDVPGFWELKRVRTERPEFGDRPDI
jgi:hypothetical protein